MRTFIIAALAFITPFAAAAQQVRIGIVAPLTGPYAVHGVQMKTAASMALEDMPASIRERLIIRFEDDQLNSAKAVTAFNALNESPGIQAVVVFGGQSVGSVAPIADRRGVLTFGITADSSLVQPHHLAFQHWLSAEEQTRAVYAELAKRQPKRIALVSTTQNAALAIREAFRTEAGRRGIDVVFADDFDPKDADFRPALLRLRASAPDTLLAVLLIPQFSLFTKQLRDFGMNTPIYGSVNAEVASEVNAAQGAMEGIIYAGPDLDEKFVAGFREKQGAHPEGPTPNVYDIVSLVGAAVKDGAADAAGIASYLRSGREFHGAMGNYKLVDGFRFDLRAVPKTIANGTFQRLYR